MLLLIHVLFGKQRAPWGRLNLKNLCQRSRNCHDNDKTALQTAYICNPIPLKVVFSCVEAVFSPPPKKTNKQTKQNKTKQQKNKQKKQTKKHTHTQSEVDYPSGAYRINLSTPAAL